MVQPGTVQCGKIMYVLYRVRFGTVMYGMQGISTVIDSLILDGSWLVARASCLWLMPHDQERCASVFGQNLNDRAWTRTRNLRASFLAMSHGPHGPGTSIVIAHSFFSASLLCGFVVVSGVLKGTTVPQNEHDWPS